MLERAGYGSVVTTNDPAEAIELCAVEPTALLLLDLHMPRADGFEVMAAVLERAPGLRAIVTTGDASPVVTEKALEAGAGSVLIKPFEYEELLRQVADQIGGSS
jgi:CheY-like chemotaxis protein